MFAQLVNGQPAPHRDPRPGREDPRPRTSRPISAACPPAIPQIMIGWRSFRIGPSRELDAGNAAVAGSGRARGSKRILIRVALRKADGFEAGCGQAPGLGPQYADSQNERAGNGERQLTAARATPKPTPMFHVVLFEARDSAEYRQCHSLVCEQRGDAAPGQALGIRTRRQEPAALRSRLPRPSPKSKFTKTSTNA